MTKGAKILGKYVVITGFKEVRIRDVHTFFEHLHERVRNSHVQLFDAKLVASSDHLYFAALNALRAFETGLNISKDAAIEALLYASGQHQIRRAVEMLGIKPRSSEMAALIISETREEADETLRIVSDLLKGKVCNDVLKLTEEKIEAIKELFNISDLEVEAASREEKPDKTLVNLVIEHMALLVTHR